MASIGEEGLALLGADVESVEGALMMAHLELGRVVSKNLDNFGGWSFRTAQFVERLPYVEELRVVYNHIINYYRGNKEMEATTRWTSALKRQAEHHHDLRGIAEAYRMSGYTCEETGDLHGALAAFRQALEILIRIGDVRHTVWTLNNIGKLYLDLGDLEQARLGFEKAVEIGESLDSIFLLGAHWGLGYIALSRGRHAEAVDHFRKRVLLSQEINDPMTQAWAMIELGWAHHAAGEEQGAARIFQEGLGLVPAWVLRGETNEIRMYILSGLEATCLDRETFRAFCHACRQEYPEIVESGLTQWYLEPAGAEDLSGLENLTGLGQTGFDSPDWTWHDPFGDCACAVDGGLAIRAANGRDLWHLNRSAPGLVRQVAGDVILQTFCRPALDDRPGIGGLLLWMDEKNYLRLDVGRFGKRQVALLGCLDNRDVAIGRGLLPESGTEQIVLRLERAGGQVRAFCRAAGDADAGVAGEWYTVGQAAFAAGPLQAGVYAIGAIDRAIYPGAYPEGTAIRFDSFQLWAQDTGG